MWPQGNIILCFFVRRVAQNWTFRCNQKNASEKVFYGKSFTIVNRKKQSNHKTHPLPDRWLLFIIRNLFSSISHMHNNKILWFSNITNESIRTFSQLWKDKGFFFLQPAGNSKPKRDRLVTTPTESLRFPRSHVISKRFILFWDLQEIQILQIKAPLGILYSNCSASFQAEIQTACTPVNLTPPKVPESREVTWSVDTPPSYINQVSRSCRIFSFRVLTFIHKNHYQKVRIILLVGI